MAYGGAAGVATEEPPELGRREPAAASQADGPLQQAPDVRPLAGRRLVAYTLNAAMGAAVSSRAMAVSSRAISRKTSVF